jgi:tetratricopeptide (TPR) repeat protein
MVSCINCATLNTLDSAFCRKCGAAVSTLEVEEAQAKLDRLASEGAKALSEARYADAVMSAETCLEANPTMLSALTLLSDARARQGDIAGALDVADRIVDLNPDSELDRIKRNKLRTQLQESIRVPETGNRGLAITAAIAAVVLVSTLGILGAKFAFGNNTVAAKDKPEITSGTENPVVTTANPPNGNQQTAGGQIQQNAQPTNAAKPGEVGAVTNQTNSEPRDATTPLRDPGTRGSRMPNIPLPTFQGGSLPSANDNISVEPVRPPGPAFTSNNTGRPKPGEDPDPTTTTAPSTTDDRNAPPAEPDPGEIEIKIRDGGPKTQGGGTRTDGGAQAMMNTARQQQLTNNSTGAAGSYEKALQAGADPVFTNQRLGLTYARAGKKDQAIDAYQKAISAGESAMASGRGDKARIQKAVDVCRQALKVLQGG